MWDALVSQSKDRYGECSVLAQEIRIASVFSSGHKAVDTFLHECLHGLWATLALQDEDKQERVISTLATGLTMLHRDNPWLAPWIEKFSSDDRTAEISAASERALRGVA